MLDRNGDALRERGAFERRKLRVHRLFLLLSCRRDAGVQRNSFAHGSALTSTPGAHRSLSICRSSLGSSTARSMSIFVARPSRSFPSAVGRARHSIVNDRLRIGASRRTRSTLRRNGQLLCYPRRPSSNRPHKLSIEHDPQEHLADCVPTSSVKYFRRMAMPSLGSPSQSVRKQLFAALVAWSLSSVSRIFA